MSEHAVQKRPLPQVQLTGLQMAAPAAALIFLSPVIAELLLGATRVSKLWLLVPEMGVYGAGALIIREIVRRRGRGWGTVLLLGIAFAILEEGVILQTSLTPQFFGAAGANSFGWAFGVQWLYLLAMLVYESVYAIVIPIQLVELLFPARRDELWLSDRSLAVAGVVFVLSSIGVWALWTQAALPNYGGSYQVPWPQVGLALLCAGILVAVTLAVRPPARPARQAGRRAVSPWLAGVLAFVFGLVWWLLVVFAFLDRAMLPGLSPVAPLVAGLGWAGLAWLTVRRLAHTDGWGDIHRLALIYGALLASMLGGALSVITATPIDRLGKLLFDLVAVALLAALAARLRRQPAPPPDPRGFARITAHARTPSGTSPPGVLRSPAGTYTVRR